MLLTFKAGVTLATDGVVAVTGEASAFSLGSSLTVTAAAIGVAVVTVAGLVRVEEGARAVVGVDGCPVSDIWFLRMGLRADVGVVGVAALGSVGECGTVVVGECGVDGTALGIVRLTGADQGAGVSAGVLG